MGRPLAVLIVEDSENDAQLIVHLLQKRGYDVVFRQVDDASQMRAALARQPWDLVISDYTMPQFDAPAALGILQEEGIDVPFIVVSGSIGEDVAVTMMKAGAHDYLMKESLARLAPAVERELEYAKQRRERKEADTLLQEVRERLQRAVSAGNVGLWDWDLRNDEVYYSSEWKRQIGFEDHEIGSSPLEWKDRVHPEDLDRILQGMEDLRNGIIRQYMPEFRFRHKDGSYRWILAQGSLLMGSDGVPIRVLGSHIDVTDRKRLEEQFLQAQKMETIGQLAGGVAHDFNNILQVLFGYTSMLLERLPEHDEAHAFAEEIALGADRAVGLTRQLLAFSSRQILEMEDLDLNKVFRGMMKMIQRIIREDIEMKVMEGQRLGIVHADRGQMEQVLLNLCVNARDAMPEGGTLLIETENVVIDGEYCAVHALASPGRYVLLSVTDTGCGMDAQTQAHIFEPFFTTKEVGKGTGLGLATVYGIVRQHQGMIQVYSEVGKGTTFKVYLPSLEGVASPVETKAVTRSEGGTETILVAEDDETLRKLAVRMLGSAGYTVLLAVDGSEAIDVFNKHAAKIDLILLDIVMPKMGGKAVYDVLRQQHPRLRFLFSSGYSTSAIHTNFVLKAGVDLIQKPYASDALFRKVREVLDRTDEAQASRSDPREEESPQ